MTFDPELLERFSQAVIEDRLTSAEFDRLKELVLQDSSALDYFTDCLLDHSMLCALAEEESLDLDEMRLLLGIEPQTGHEAKKSASDLFLNPVSNTVSSDTFPDDLISNLELDDFLMEEYSKETIPGKRFPSWLRIGKIGGIALLLAVIFATSIPFLFFGKKQDMQFASIIRTTNCLWADSSTQTSPGTRLGRCTLRLEEGIALIHFDCKAAVSIEGPCVFELKSSKNTILHSGRLVAEVLSEEGKGFVVETPQGLIRDLGTKFAVYAPEGKPSNVYVLDGKVEVFSDKSKSSVSLSKGSSLFLGKTDAEETVAPEQENDILQISSAMGRGKETWIVKDIETALNAERLFPLGVSEPFMLVKLSCENDERSDRKGVFRVDISTLQPKDKNFFSSVSLCLSYGPTELGYASSVPDSTFTVYGLTAEQYDDWNEKSIDWAGLPGNSERNKLLPEFWQALGTFSIKQGSRRGTVQISGNKLKDFVRRDTNDLLTFAIVRETPATAERGLVHGFANRHHPTLMPPRLIFQFKNNPIEE